LVRSSQGNREATRSDRNLARVQRLSQSRAEEWRCIFLRSSGMGRSAREGENTGGIMCENKGNQECVGRRRFLLGVFTRWVVGKGGGKKEAEPRKFLGELLSEGERGRGVGREQCVCQCQCQCQCRLLRSAWLGLAWLGSLFSWVGLSVGCCNCTHQKKAAPRYGHKKNVAGAQRRPTQHGAAHPTSGERAWVRCWGLAPSAIMTG